MNLSRGPGRPPLIMGILNVTPDSFSDGGLWNDPERAVRHASEMVDEGVIDVGAESTRPGSEPISAAEEWSRLGPILRELVELDVPVSVDTMKTDIAERSLSMGAEIINDVNGLQADGMMEVCADHGAAAVICHSYGVPGTHSMLMSGDYKGQIASFISGQCRKAEEAGIQDIAVDPGLGFGKTAEQNYEIVRDCSFLGDGRPILIGLSRKRFVVSTFPDMDVDEASVMLSKMAADSGASIIRTHDVGRTVSALRP